MREPTAPRGPRSATRNTTRPALVWEFHAAEAEIAALSSQERGCVRVAAFQSSCATLVPAMLDLLGQTNAHVEVLVHQMEPPEAAKGLLAGDIDLGLMCDWENETVAQAEQPLRRQPLMTDRRCVLLPVDHALANSTEIEFATLADEAWVVETARDRFSAACVSAGFRPRIAATADDQVTIQSLVASGAGIALMNELALATHLDPRLSARPLANWPRRRIYASTWPEMAGVPAVATVLDSLRAVARRLRTRLPSGHRQQQPEPTRSVRHAR